MELKEILAVSGYPGLYKFVAQSTRGVIVEALADGKRMNVPSNARVSTMTDISVFTEGEDRPLADIFTAFYTHTGGKPTIGHKEDPRKIAATFAEVVPDYDPDRVHASDMKKIVQWFNALVAAGMTEFTLPDYDAPAEASDNAPDNAPDAE
ncbi:MAG: DUF5606 domain-containing protein [Alistipes sp.]|jgi:hypothetical protein|nr:DUF5606 domain-containing protein [Alistipes sp.]